MIELIYRATRDVAKLNKSISNVITTLSDQSHSHASAHLHTASHSSGTVEAGESPWGKYATRHWAVVKQLGKIY